MNQDAKSGRGFCFIDPHGDAAQELYNSLDEHAKQKTVYLDFTNRNLNYGYNIFRSVAADKRSLVASSILEVFKRNWKSAWGPKMENILMFSILTLLEAENTTLADLPKLLLDQEFRLACTGQLANKEVANFWADQFPKYKPQVDLLPILNKSGPLLSHPILNSFLTDQKPQISLRSIMDTGKILIINLSIGSMGSSPAAIIGGLLMVSLASAAYSRIELSVESRRPFFIYIDEFQFFAGDDLLSQMVMQIRKFGIGLILSVQTISNLDASFRIALLGNIANLVVFRCGIQDARMLSSEFHPVFSIEDFMSLANREIYLKMLIDNRPCVPFSAVTIQKVKLKDFL